MKPTLLVLAAGMGSRYGGLKQLDGVGPNDEPILEYSVFDALRAGFGKIVFVIRPNFADDFKTKIASKFADRVPIEYAYQTLSMLPEGFRASETRQKPWGTGQAVLVTENIIQEPFVVINADDLYGPSAYRLLAHYLSTLTDSQSPEFIMVGYILRNTLSPFGSVARGLCQVEDGYLQSIVELTKIELDGGAEHLSKYTTPSGDVQKLSGNEIVSMNIWGLTPLVYPHLQKLFRQFLEEKGQEEKSEFYIPNAIDQLVQTGQARVKVLESQDPWLGVTYRDDKPYVLEKLQALIKQDVYPENLWA